MDMLNNEALSQTSFDIAWRAANRKYSHAKKTFFAGKLVSNLGNLFFVLFVLTALVGQIYTWFPEYREFLDILPLFVPVWQLFAGTFIPAGAPVQEHVIRIIIFAFVFSIALSIALALFAYLIYHPIAKKQTGDRAADSKAMTDKLYKSRKLINQTKAGSAMFSILFFIGIMLLISIYFFYLSEDPAELAAFTDKLRAIPSLMIIVLASCFAILMVISVSIDTLSNITALLYRCKVPYDQIAEAERFLVFASLAGQELTDEELVQKAVSLGEEKRLEAMELEKNKEYIRSRRAFLEASVAGDVISMENCSRHHIIAADNEAAIYWLQKFVDSGSADDVALTRLKRLKRGKKVDAHFYN